MRRLAAAVLVAACGSAPVPAPVPAAEPAPEPEPAPAAAADAVAADAIPEIEARVILSAMFRAAGYRVVYDVPLTLGDTTVAVDGYDPEAQIGYEYRAPGELAAWSGAVPERSDVKLLVIDAADRDAVEARGRAFLASVAQAE